MWKGFIYRNFDTTLSRLLDSISLRYSLVCCSKRYVGSTSPKPYPHSSLPVCSGCGNSREFGELRASANNQLPRQLCWADKAEASLYSVNIQSSTRTPSWRISSCHTWLEEHHTLRQLIVIIKSFITYIQTICYIRKRCSDRLFRDALDLTGTTHAPLKDGRA